MTLLFMPDISGFTRFVNAVEINHSKHIVKELLELLIDTNRGQLELAEIEGDALFYYHQEGNISPTDLIEQIQEMYERFHTHLLLYHYKRVCNCGACTTANGLQLKFIVHVGGTEMIEINGNKKPFGPDVITLHRLLKNKAEQKEYIIFSEDYWKQNQTEIEGKLGSNYSIANDEFDFGPYSYAIFPLEIPKVERKEDIKFPQLNQEKFVQIDYDFEVDYRTLYQYVADLGKRIQWIEGLDDFIFNKNHLNQVGESHVCVINGKNVSIETIYANVEGNDLIFIEDTADVPLMKSAITLYSVSAKNSGSTLTVKAYLKPKNFLGKLFVPILSKKLKENLGKSLKRLENLLQETVDL